MILVVEVGALPDSPTHGSELETTAENLMRFLYDQRTNWPGAVLDSVSLAKELKNLGAHKFQVTDVKGGKKALSFRTLAGRLAKLGTVVQDVFGKLSYAKFIAETKAALKAGARGTAIAFIVVGAIDVVQELLQDGPSLRRLGVDLAVDTVKLLASLLAAAAVTAAVVTLGASAAVVAGVGLAVGVAAGVTLDKVDASLGVTQGLQEIAERLQREGEWNLRVFLLQLERALLHHVSVPADYY